MHIRHPSDLFVRMNSHLHSFLCFTVLLLVFVSTPLIAGNTNPAEILHRGNSTEPVTLDPHQSEDVSSGNILRDLFEGLVTEDAEGNIIPGIDRKSVG